MILAAKFNWNFPFYGAGWKLHGRVGKNLETGPIFRIFEKNAFLTVLLAFKVDDSPFRVFALARAMVGDRSSHFYRNVCF